MNRYIAPVIFLLLSVGTYILYIDPIYTEIKAGLVREHELLKYIEDAKTAQAKITELKQRYESFPVGADQSLHALLPDSIDSTRLIIDMSAVFEKRGLIMKSPTVASGGIAPQAGVSAYQVSFGVSAPYSVFRQLLRDLEASLALRDMSTIAFSANGAGAGGEWSGTSETAVHDYSVNITTYSFAQ